MTSSVDIASLVDKSQWLRKEIFEMIAPAGQGHIASALSQVEIGIALFYGGIVNFSPGEPNDPNRDRVIVSKGHSASGLYPIYADLGYLPKSELRKFGTSDGILRIYGDKSIPGVECTSGSLSQAPSIACGFCYSFKMNRQDSRAYVILSDGEHYEGQLWESALFASHYELDNLIFIVDRNHLIILGDSEDCLKLEPLEKKWEAFGWDTYCVDGHSYGELLEALSLCSTEKNGRPKVVIADTVKGKGVSYMEGVARWHNTFPNADEIAIARRDLENNCISLGDAP